VVGSTLSDIIDCIKRGALPEAEDYALALRDKHLPTVMGRYEPGNKVCDGRVLIHVPHRDITLKVSGMVGILISLLYYDARMPKALWKPPRIWGVPGASSRLGKRPTLRLVF